MTLIDEEVPKGALLIEIFRADNTAYSKKLNKDWGTLSGTKVRERPFFLRKRPFR